MAALSESDDYLAECFVRHGNGYRAAREAGFSKRGGRRLQEPDVLAACLVKAIRILEAGQSLDKRAQRRLRELGRACLLKGRSEHGIDGLPPVEEAYRQFRLLLGLDREPGGEGGATPSPSQACGSSLSPGEREGAARSDSPLLGEREGPGGEAYGRVRGRAASPEGLVPRTT
ncbi:hypothetical protein, partial [Inquilinus limosus]